MSTKEMNVNMGIEVIFDSYQQQLDTDIEIREKIKDLCNDIHQLSRVISNILQDVHYNKKDVAPACLKARAKFEIAREGYLKLKNIVPCHDYFKFYDQWRTMTQKYCFHISFTIWLETGTMASYDTVAEVLGLGTKEEKTSFHLTREDYLIGILILCSELARLALSSVSKQEYSRPLQISKFVMEVNSGFRLLNLKNDYLRKRYDALKYDVKKIEEVIYDLSLRGLLKYAKNNAKEGQEIGKAEEDLKNAVAEGQEKEEAEKSLKDGEAEGQEKGEAEKSLRDGETEGQENEKAEEDLNNEVAEGQKNVEAEKSLRDGETEGQENEKAEEDLNNEVAEGQKNVEAEAGGDADKYDDKKLEQCLSSLKLSDQ